MATPDLGIVLGGGGARAAYQVGVLKAIASEMPDAHFPIITGVSAGGINAAFLASCRDRMDEELSRLLDVWANLSIERVFDPGSLAAGRLALGWLRRFASPSGRGEPPRALLDTGPLRQLLHEALETGPSGRLVGVAESIADGRTHALALTTLDYTTGQTVTWTEGADLEQWRRPNRKSSVTELTVDHVMASAALPLIFPAIRIGDHWYGDGGIRLTAPLSPAMHLGARKLLVISTRYQRSDEEEEKAETTGYPPPAQIMGHLMKAVFLDVIDQDVLRVERLNQLLERIPEEKRGRFRPIELVVIRPSVDLGRLSARHEISLPRFFRRIVRSLGSGETSSPDFLSMLMFEPEYLQELIAVGEKDGRNQIRSIRALFEPEDESAGRLSEQSS